MVSELSCALSTRHPHSRGCSPLVRHQDSPSKLPFVSREHRLHYKAWLGTATLRLPLRRLSLLCQLHISFLTSLESEE